MLWLTIGSAFGVAALYFGIYKFFNRSEATTTHTVFVWESDDEWHAQRVPRLRQVVRSRFARF